MFNTCEIGVSKSCCWWVSSSWMLFCIGWSIATSVSKNHCALEMLITIYQSTWHNIPGESWCLMLATNPFRMLYFQFQIKGLKYMKHNFTCCFVCMQNFASLWIWCSGTYFDPRKRMWKLQNERNKYYCPHKTGVIESRRMRWAEHEVHRQATNFWEVKI